MKFTCEKYIFQAAAATAARAAASKSPITALEGVLIEAGENVRITGYDLKKGIYTTLPADISAPGAVVIGAKLLSEILRCMPEGIVSFSVSHTGEASIKCEKSEFTLMCTPAEEYPEMIPVDEGYRISINRGKLKSMINQTIFAVSANESRPVYTGSMFEIDEDRLRVMSVDGYRLARREETLEGECGNIEFIVPGSALQDAEKLCVNEEEEVRVTVGAKQLSFSFGETVLISRRLEGEFINFTKSVPDTFNTFATIDRLLFQRAIERLSLIIDEKIKSPLRCKFTAEGIELLCVTARGRAEDYVPVMSAAGPELEIGFNNRYLLDAVKAAPAETLKICLGSATSPCVIKPEDESTGFVYMVLPVRLSGK